MGDTLHSKTPRIRYQCEQCESSFSERRGLIGHVSAIHTGDKVDTRCDKCDHVFGDRSNYLRHLRYVHTDVKACVCEQCGSAMKTKEALHKHVKAMHALSKDFKC